MSTPRYVVLGHPIEHSLSPQIHRAFAQQLNIDLNYDKIDVAPEDFAAFWHDGEGRDLAGANVTFPLKQLAFELVDETDQEALEAGAVNTIVRRDDMLIGHNTDGVGLLTDLLKNLQLPVNGQRLLLIGAGGAARGVLGPLLREGPAELVIANRTLSKAEALFERFRGKAPMCISALDQLGSAGEFDGIINATSLGYSTDGDDSSSDAEVTLPECVLKNTSWCYDLNYGKAALPFLDWASHAGCAKVHDGLGMLVEQAAESFRYWHGRSPQTGEIIAQFR